MRQVNSTVEKFQDHYTACIEVAGSQDNEEQNVYVSW